MTRCIVLHRSDNVATLIDPAREGDRCALQGEGEGQVTARQDIAFGHKVCVADIAAGAPVRKYGQVIGLATREIRRGEHAHVHNFDSARARGDLQAR
ncbi:MAG TPA: UxaA family hydrolase [Ramlibacter sp.]|nr:UxaA family hydrolase [Ramlibacter sp.]